MHCALVGRGHYQKMSENLSLTQGSKGFMIHSTIGKIWGVQSVTVILGHPVQL